MAGILLDVFHQNLRKKYIGSPYCVGIVNLLIQILIMVNEKSYLFVTYWLLHVLQQTISMLYFALWLSNRNIQMCVSSSLRQVFDMHYRVSKSFCAIQIQDPIYSSINSPLWTPTVICTICFSRYFSKSFHEVMSIDFKSGKSRSNLNILKSFQTFIHAALNYFLL